MKRVITFLSVSAFVGVVALSSVASADSTIPGAYFQTNNGQVMGVGQTIMEMGAKDRALTNASNLSSQAGVARNITGVNQDYQFGSSQSEQSWKQWRSVEDAGGVVGLVPGDCRGDNTEGVRMDPFGNPYMEEKLVSQADCEINHGTIQ
ncbi:MAG: hypothetical protein H8E32_06160 [Nitrospinae bacterium]|nr:hypothetical protein [Nitrospinota bacterium]